MGVRQDAQREIVALEMKIGRKNEWPNGNCSKNSHGNYSNMINISSYFDDKETP